MRCHRSSSGGRVIPGLLLFQISVMDQFLCHFFAELQLAVAIISIKILVGKGAVDLHHSKQERMDPMWPPLCSPCLLQTEGTLSSVVVIIHCMPVFEVIVHNGAPSKTSIGRPDKNPVILAPEWLPSNTKAQPTSNIHHKSPNPSPTVH